MAMKKCAPIIVSANHKGGVGKTVGCRVLAQSIAKDPKLNKGKPVLLVDLDPQANTSKRWRCVRLVGDYAVPVAHPDLVGEDVAYSSVCDIWLSLLTAGKTRSAFPLPYRTSDPMIHLVPADEERFRDVVRLPIDKEPQLGAFMTEWLRDPSIADEYCCVIIDTPPNKESCVAAALAAATHVLIPFIPEPQSAQGVISVVAFVERMATQRKENEEKLHHLGLLPNRVMPQTRLHADVLATIKDLRGIGDLVMPVKLQSRIAFAETDNWASEPDAVLPDPAGTHAEAEAHQFSHYVMKQIERWREGKSEVVA